MKQLIGLLSLAALVLPLAAGASNLQIQFTNLNLQYDGGALYDGGVANTVRAGSPADADVLNFMDFLVDGTSVGSLTSNIFADIYIPGVTNIPVGGGTVLSSAPIAPVFGFDLLTSGSTPGWGLALNLDSPMEIRFNGTNLTVLGSAVTGSIANQALPYGLVIGTPVTISFSTQIDEFTHNGQTLTNFRSSGTGEVRGPVSAIPEPGTLVLLGIGLLGGGAVSARRRRK